MKNLALVIGLTGLIWTPAAAADRPIPKSFHQLPFSFERAQNGTWMAHGTGCRVGVGPAGATIATGAAQIRMSFLGGRGDAEAMPEDLLPGKFNYLIGADPKLWVRDVPTFGRVRYHNVYDGVDVAWHGGDGGLEYDLALAPGTDASRIALRFDGAGKLALEPGGDLRIQTPAGPLTMRVPVVYQGAAGVRTRVEARYVLRAGDEVGFELAKYDKSRPLVIDPTLVYAAWFDSQNVSVTSMARDPQGNMYVGGTASWLPTINAVQGDMGYSDPFVIKFDPTGTTMLYATFVGSGVMYSSDTLYGLAVDSTGNVVATGSLAYNGTFPTVNAAESSCKSQYCGFVFRLNPPGNGLVYSTLVSGAYGIAVAADTAQNAYVTGSADESSFQTTLGAYSKQAGGSFVEKYAADGSVQYATLLGAQGVGYGPSTVGNAIAVDQEGFAYIAGSTALSGFQGVPGARSVTGTTGVFVAKLGADGKALPWAALLGGSGTDNPHAIARDTSGVLYVAGETTSTDLPVTAGVIQPAGHGQSDGFIASVSADGSAFGFVTYLGGSADDQIYAMALTSGGQIVVAGDTLSPDFPVSGAVQPVMGGGGPLYATTDSGSHWTAEGAGLGSSVNVLSVDPTNPAVIVAATGEGLFRTTNGGVSWTEVDTPGGGFFGVPAPGPNYTDLSRSLANPAVLYALRNDSSVSKSSDSGATWTVPAFIPTSSGMGALYIVASPADENTFLVIGWDGSVFPGNTVPFRPPSIATMDYYPAASPDGSIYIGMFSGSLDGIGKSTDDGNSWSFLAESPSGPSVDGLLSVCTANPAVLYAANYYHLYLSGDAGLTWTTSNFAGWPYRFAAAPSNCQVVYELTGPQVSVDGGATWSSAAGDLTASILNNVGVVDPTNPAHVWVVANVYPDGFVAKISNDGKTLLWSTFYGGSNAEDVHGVAVDGSGNAWIAGSTLSTDLPLTTGLPQAPPYQSVLMLAEISDATAACSYNLTPGSTVSYGAGIINFALTAPSGCAWTATPAETWITTVNPAAGTASAPIAAVVSANNTNATRTGTITLGNQSFTITQASSSCQYAVDNNTFVVPASGGQVTVNVTAGTGCPWSVAPGGLTVVSGGSGTGNGGVTLSAPANSSMRPVSYTANVGPNQVTVTVADSCTYSLSPLTFDGSLTYLSITVTASSAVCFWSASTTATWLTTGADAGTGSGPLVYGASTNHTGATRTANITIDSQSFTLTQTADMLPQYTLTVLVQPGGAGTAGANVTADSGTVLCLSETANTGWMFLSWTGATFGAGGASNCLTLNSDVTVTANFTTTAQFSDVQPGDSFFDAANLMFQAGVTTGCVQSSTPQTRTFCPDDNVTRQEMAAFIVRAVTGSVAPAIYNTTPYFQDVPPSSPFFPHIQKLMDLDITTGCAQNPALFCPTATIPRWEMAVFMIRARLALYGATFTTASAPYFADVPTNVEGNGMPFPYIQRAYEEAVTAGCGTNPLMFCPDDLVTRGQTASFIMRALFNETMVLGPTAPYLTGVSPYVVAATLGSQITVTITGANTNFQTGDTVTVPSGMLTVSNVVVDSATSITATLTVSASAVAGPQALVVTSGGQDLTLPLAIRVGMY